jgi:hypothetical protein
VKALVGNLIQPSPNLRVDVRKIGEGTQRPKVFPKVSNAIFNFGFRTGSFVIKRPELSAFRQIQSQELALRPPKVFQ